MSRPTRSQLRRHARALYPDERGLHGTRSAVRYRARTIRPPCLTAGTVASRSAHRPGGAIVVGPAFGVGPGQVVRYLRGRPDDDPVGVGDLPQAANVAAVRAAVDRAQASTLVDQLPDGLDTQRGRSYDPVRDVGAG